MCTMSHNLESPDFWGFFFLSLLLPCSGVKSTSFPFAESPAPESPRGSGFRGWHQGCLGLFHPRAQHRCHISGETRNGLEEPGPLPLSPGPEVRGRLPGAPPDPLSQAWFTHPFFSFTGGSGSPCYRWGVARRPAAGAGRGLTAAPKRAVPIGPSSSDAVKNPGSLRFSKDLSRVYFRDKQCPEEAPT